MKSNEQIIAEELAKHGKVPVSKPATTAAKRSAPVEEKKPKTEPKVVSAVAGTAAPVEPQKTDVTISLTEAEIAGLTREANLLGITWQTHLGDLVMETLSARVAKSLITGPSYASKKVTGPSQFGAHFNGA